MFAGGRWTINTISIGRSEQRSITSPCHYIHVGSSSVCGTSYVREIPLCHWRSRGIVEQKRIVSHVWNYYRTSMTAMISFSLKCHVCIPPPTRQWNSVNDAAKPLVTNDSSLSRVWVAPGIEFLFVTQQYQALECRVLIYLIPIQQMYFRYTFLDITISFSARWRTFTANSIPKTGLEKFRKLLRSRSITSARLTIVFSWLTKLNFNLWRYNSMNVLIRDRQSDIVGSLFRVLPRCDIRRAGIDNMPREIDRARELKI